MDISRTPTQSSSQKKRSSSATRLSNGDAQDKSVTASAQSLASRFKRSGTVPNKESAPESKPADSSLGLQLPVDLLGSAEKPEESPAEKAPVEQHLKEPGRWLTESIENESPPDAPGPELPAASGAASILKRRPFIIRTIKHDGGDGGEVTGSILSQSLDKLLAAAKRTDAGTLTMSGLRKLVPQMSRYPSLQKFCTPSGTFIDDEAISFAEYLALEDGGDATDQAASGTPGLKVFFRSTKLADAAGKGADGGDASAVTAPNLGEEPSIKAPEFADVGEMLKKSEVVQLLNYKENTKGAGNLSASTLTEEDWQVVLRNCAVFYGWLIDPVSRRIVRAPKPAFRLRPKDERTDVDSVSDWQKQKVVSKSHASSIVAKKDGNGDKATTGKNAPLTGPTKKTAAADGDKKAPVADGDKKDPKDEEDADEDGDEDAAPAQETPVRAVIPKTDRGLPNFRVNDDSRIEITAHEDELTVSMAKSDFSEQSTEVSVSGGGFGVSVGVSAGYASSKASTSKSMNNSLNRTMVARYMFPRCDLIFWPDELEPTEELAKLVEEVRTTKNIKVLRRLQAEFGQLFCQRVTLGGRLLSTKVLSSTETKTLEESKESFKASVGASVSGSYGGYSGSASAKHEQSAGSTSVDERNARSQNEAAVFEAVGGDTILANNPTAWSGTVGDSANWRVINRDGLSSLVEFLSAMPGYEPVQSWFVQAVPAMSKYITLNKAHECQARLRVTTPSNSLSIPNTGNNASFYLGHDPDAAVTPRLNGVKGQTIETYWIRIDIKEDIPIFNPPTYRAPTIIGYNNFEVESIPYGAEYTAGYVKTEWTIIAPFDEELMHGTRVILRSTDYVDPSKTKANEEATAPPVSHMVVYRNTQGEFLPAMSDSDEYQYWRIIKSNPTTRHIQPGDEVSLIWDFNDQTTGWRDFKQDIFGRRQGRAPEELGGTGPLFLKVPWPRFEHTNQPTTMIMSPERGDVAARPMTINNKGQTQTYSYGMQDVRFQIDSVGNNGRGDSQDYLLSKLKMEGVYSHVGTSIKCFPRSPAPPMQMRSSIFWYGIW